MTEQQLNNEVLSKLFTDETTVRQVVGGSNQLGATAQLTALATDIAKEVATKVLANPEENEPQILASQRSHDAMDELINDFYNLKEVDIEFLRNEDEDTIDKMIRSQQSKRSRAKAKATTHKSWMAMMTGAVAENLLRLASGKAKQSGGGGAIGEIGFNEDDLEHFALHPEELKKAIRNVQSKKSIMKSKVDFSEDSDRWQQLLKAEEQLKEIRDQVNGNLNEKAKEAIEAKAKVEEMLASKDIDDIPADEAKELLDKVKEMLASRE